MEEQMDFTKMSLTELSDEMEKFRNQLENQKMPITPAQKSRWNALKRIYKQKNEEIAK
ncbi:MAG: hypothetical protein UHM08_09245 [Bacteroidales bacterium]|nr:hypothetical protein [Bacteroidales bacterium]